MKINKLIELWKEMEESINMREKRQEGMHREEADELQKLDPEEILNVIQFLGRCAAAAGYHCELKEPSKETGIFKVTVTERNRIPVIAQVKIWDNKEHKIDTRFSLRRFVTGDEGALEVILPCGYYEAEISCGPEYDVQWVCFTVESGKTYQAQAMLNRIVHLTDNGWLAGDLHHHSIYSSPAYGGTDPVIETPEEVCRSMKSLGMQFGALSDHHNVLNHEEWKKQNKNFTPIISKEISTSNGHVLQLGVDDDVIYDIPKGRERTNERLRSEFIRICKEIRDKGGLPQVNHPFDASFSTRYNSEFLDMIEIFESIEIWNGATPFMEGTINGKAFRAWLQFLEQGKRLTATAGSDTHNIYGDDYFGMAEWINWLMGLVKNHPEIFPEQIRTKADYMLGLYESIWPMLVKWVERSNTPSNIHNYVRTEGKKEPEEILQAIREGKVFVSNGPLLVPFIGRAGIGEKASLVNQKADIHISLLSREPIAHLYLYTGAEKKAELSLTEQKTESCFYDYSMDFKNYYFENAQWAVFVADGGVNCKAVTNPIYLTR